MKSLVTATSPPKETARASDVTRPSRAQVLRNPALIEDARRDWITRPSKTGAAVFQCFTLITGIVRLFGLGLCSWRTLDTVGAPPDQPLVPVRPHHPRFQGNGLRSPMVDAPAGEIAFP